MLTAAAARPGGGGADSVDDDVKLGARRLRARSGQGGRHRAQMVMVAGDGGTPAAAYADVRTGARVPGIGVRLRAGRGVGQQTLAEGNGAAQAVAQCAARW